MLDKLLPLEPKRSTSGLDHIRKRCEEGFHVTHTYASRCMEIGLVLAMEDKIGWHRTTAPS
ncbi:hypothetical protein FA13DRAFT_1728762 [Coprinellus micaceus]|uniref:Uncharacterized protein n=1 Tax=Coprinellus micaceus TaxID=71717 RepID=A0A4Y7TLY5_COPMI|nr:hypothetical protein FA13DRAFT_1728762 [Coprinellus micaceus]